MATAVARGMSLGGQDVTLVNRTMRHMRQFICGLHGHDALLHFEAGRLSLQCSSCGHESPGWDLTGPASQTDARPKSRLIQLSLVRERKAA